MKINPYRKILIIGASGNIGYPLYKSLKNNFYTLGTYNENYKKNLIKFDVNKDKLSIILKNNKFTDLILCQGIINFNKISTNPGLAKKTNLDSLVLQLKTIKKENNLKIIYFSSESIFDGLNGNYSERSKPKPILDYGLQKYKIENFIKNNFKDYLILRISKVYNTNLRQPSLITNWYNQLKRNENIILANDNFLTPIHINDILKFIVKLIILNSKGIFNISSDDNKSRSELFDIFYKRYNKLFKSKSKIFRIPLDQIQNKNLNIPKNTALINKKVKKITGITPKSLDYYSKILLNKN